ncbi:unnamed protein product [Heligmosomoides polygyrus]|uniref:DUF4145 domain-containing protein n=1 Tax=Heligmosomoides polygyrus TaxID=6339 RepID=A0A183GRQ9_HELPZ|nr:unnamed protein product [Heligmosomoides polygyrus]
MRAIMELRNPRRKPGQEVADFCVVIGRLGGKTNHDRVVESKSLEYAQILLENLRDWFEYVQLMSALHRVEPSKATKRSNNSH